MSLDRIWSIPGRLGSLAAYRDHGARWASDHLPLVADVLPLHGLTAPEITSAADSPAGAVAAASD
jgi:hypothetical protein